MAPNGPGGASNGGLRFSHYRGGLKPPTTPTSDDHVGDAGAGAAAREHGLLLPREHDDTAVALNAQDPLLQPQGAAQDGEAVAMVDEDRGLAVAQLALPFEIFTERNAGGKRPSEQPGPTIAMANQRPSKSPRVKRRALLGAVARAAAALAMTIGAAQGRPQSP
eukprot:CAMPEP_0170202962 /NCGR_PEP_ID=MMETSP0116_2-20130129/973_1 /TAXON_ID=400756 /ORGANISM="Durinskia baltica, Strain CSIRO CS-38" /LENGTH=163 /DNA_ID=CAMNT_0010453249 /DNA_START=356 /DNA_END=846 /DNA_ORIENTATION=-